MKHFLLMIAVASFAFAGAAQKEQPKKTPATKTTIAAKKTPAKNTTTAAKKTPTPTKKSTTTAKKSTTPTKKAAPIANKGADKSDSTKKARPSNEKTSDSTAKSNTKKKAPAASKTTTAGNTAKPKPKATPGKKDDKGDLDKALTIEDPDQKITALTKFLTDFPKSDLRTRAQESLTAARVAFGDANLEAGDPEYGLKLIREAMREAPVPYPEKLFVEIISKVPSTLYLHGERAAAIEAAAAIEKNSTSSVPQLLSLANFHLSTENGTEAKRLAEAAIKLDEKSSAAYQTLGMANRLNFDLEASSEAFSKASELDRESVVVRRSLADMKRALGKPDEAIALYTEVLAKDPSDLPSQTGRILSLFESGKRNEAELELSQAIEANSANVVLLAGAAYWYGSAGEPAKAIDLAGKAIAAEPRYIWSHIALARAFSAEGRFSEAEQTLLKAKKYGNFATLEYEIAAVRFANGFYREAAEELRKSFVAKDGMVFTKLGRRIERSEKTFPELLAHERRASILLPKSADNVDEAERMKTLLEFSSLLASSSPDPARAAELADAFAKGTDRMRFHRQTYAASALLDKRIAPAKALELSRAAVSAVDDGLSIPSPAAPIMANELYDRRVAAMAMDRYVVVPELPKQALSAIARGRIEELAGWSLMQQGNHAEAVTRLRRAISILPEKSVWWRSTIWRLGTALEAYGKDKDALDVYVRTYTSSEPDAAKYASIEAVFKRVNGGSDGLDALIGAKPVKAAEKVAEAPPASPVETKKETSGTTTAAIEEKSASTNPPVAENKAESKKLPEEVAVIPASVPIDTNKKTDAAPIEEKPVEKAEPPPVSKIEEKQTEHKQPEKAEGKPAEKVEMPPVTKIQEKQPEQKQLEKAAETPSHTPVETPKKVVPPPVEETPVTRDDVPPATAKVEETSDEAKKPAAKPLFEPVIIEVRKAASPTKEPESSADTADKSTSRRSRVVDRKPTVSVPPPCNVTVSKEDISLEANGGSIGVLVDVDGDTDPKLLAAAASSPKDLAVTRQPEIAGVSGRAFMIKSLTNAAGSYKVIFAAPCGKKEVSVKVQ